MDLSHIKVGNKKITVRKSVLAQHLNHLREHEDFGNFLGGSTYLLGGSIAVV